MATSAGHVAKSGAQSRTAASAMLVRPRTPQTQRERSAGPGNQRTQRTIATPIIQAKLSISAPGDRFEQQADRVANAVMRMPEGASPTLTAHASDAAPIQRKCAECERALESSSGSVQRKCAACERENADLQAKETPGESPQVTPELSRHVAALNGGGQPLSRSERAFFEPRFGRDFGAVRVHADSAAGESARLAHARAFTTGPHVVFGAGQYAPGTQEGRRLLAHELTHVVQQGGASRGASTTSHIQRELVEVGAGLTIGAVIAKCIVGAIGGAIFDGAIQAVLYSIREWTWRFWRASWDYCSLILSAAIGCIAAPISAATLEPWLASRLGPVLGGIEGTLLGKLLLYLAKKVAVGIPSFIVKSLAKLGCISPEQARELGVNRNAPEPPSPDPVPPAPVPTPRTSTNCEPLSGDVQGGTRVLMKVNTADFLNESEGAKLDQLADSLRGSSGRVRVHGVASTDGPSSFNDRLSCTRALRGAQLLEERGIPGSRIAGIFKHGEVPGPRETQRSVIYEVEGAPAPGPRPGPGPSPNPNPNPNPSPTPLPEVKLRSLQFLSDYGGAGPPLLKNNRDNWAATGSPFPATEWQASKPDEAAPITHEMGKNIDVAVTVEVPSGSPAGSVFTLRGQGSTSWLNFAAQGLFDGNATQTLALRSAAPLPPNKIGRFPNQTILWSLHAEGQVRSLGVTGAHDVYSTIAAPPRPGEATHRRMDKATEVTTESRSLDPHAIVRHIMANWNEYNLRTKLSPTGWEWVDNFRNGAQCIDIVRFVQGVFNLIGAPGQVDAVVVFATPDDPTRAKEELWETSEALKKFPGVALLDGDWKANNFEAALKLNHDGRLAYYPGGVDNVLTTPQEVLNVFRCLARIRPDPACPLCRIEHVYANYRFGPCPPGAQKECWHVENCTRP